MQGGAGGGGGYSDFNTGATGTGGNGGNGTEWGAAGSGGGGGAGGHSWSTTPGGSYAGANGGLYGGGGGAGVYHTWAGFPGGNGGQGVIVIEYGAPSGSSGGGSSGSGSSGSGSSGSGSSGSGSSGSGSSGSGSSGGGSAGTSVLDLGLSEDAWQGDAQFTVSVDGKQVGGVMSAHALHSTGDSEHVKLTGNWGSGAHTVGVTFLNDAWGGSSSADRNLYVSSIALNGTQYANTSAALMGNQTQTFAVGGSASQTSANKNALTLHLSEDAWRGDAQFQISVDGKTITTPDVVKALHSAGAVQDFTITGLSSGAHDVGVTFLNDAYGGSSSTDRNLYVNSIDYGSQHFATNAALTGNSTQHFTV